MRAPPMRDWKVERIKHLAEEGRFFGRDGMTHRESWTVRQILRALNVNFADTELKRPEEPVDVAFRDARFQVKEILDDGRKRGDELKTDLAIALAANDESELIEPYPQADISFTQIVRICYERAEALSRVKYGPHECKSVDVLYYFNWVNHHVIPPIDVPNEKTAFRSLSIVSNVYCAVVSANVEAPMLLRENVGKAIKYFET